MWQKKDGELYREFRFKDFKQAFSFMTEVAEAAERMQHHPRWENEYNKVAIWLRTHSANAITDKDRQLVAKIDTIFKDYE